MKYFVVHLIRFTVGASLLEISYLLSREQARSHNSANGKLPCLS